MGPDGKIAMKIHRRKIHGRYQCTSSNEWCFKTYSSHSNAPAHFLRKNLEENESTEDPDMDRTALEDVSDKKAARKNVLVTDSLKSEIRPRSASKSFCKRGRCSEKLLRRENDFEVAPILEILLPKMAAIQVCYLRNSRLTTTTTKARLRQEKTLRRFQHEIIQELRGNIRVFSKIRLIIPSDKMPVGNISHLRVLNVDSLTN
ncbi:hypothetical protein DAPPUDRAFT_116593 [Daphnia pulex]|uniref:Uncharacterized protein n=1 Tax=Daphnia pulex TaxID=6669 RepID=E9HPU5_DAPPU|nr:hypothetical protein DAPPUDRAFT_116593 [Daphnia pulex]|eukprot:EFX66219.1 hypothetical protein DAPPUDRAFT_116593 [Daphnia pulex]